MLVCELGMVSVWVCSMVMVVCVCVCVGGGGGLSSSDEIVVLGLIDTLIEYGAWKVCE